MGIAQVCGVNESCYSTRRTANNSTAKISTRDKGKAPANASSSKSYRARVELIDEYEEEDDDTRDDVELLDDDDDDAEHVVLDHDDDA